ncbi:SusC/RagA family TonB-linked outer membrane protein [Sphingobacterium alkalisoli]|uniref:SusC/RagA family TonB-linked outer membrane protein n=1 Tax=Sphingobacterium alkalisoli TaxID=1874115 RepID=A0A4V5LX81_9SPHI|nr:SusC/RagA family TonB-linked outer membrane protein [Sphingobacterium alkalisoli]TJY61529.1 SusC/RagA family TonB-linked outer membrane protein [Sphingobacterium alkalisoli]GGH29822.1 SusC/RagA family TonB-linked outer membrane protein [Sphingobacterium alkalisoli]
MATKLLTAVLCFFFLCVSAINSNAQTGVKRIWGEVIDEKSGKTIEGINMRFSRSLTRSQSDSTGAFYLLLRYPSDTLIFSGIDYEEVRHPVNDTTALPLMMELRRSNNVIEEVVIESGFQSIPKERATGSYAFIDSSLWNQRIGSNVMSRLDGLTNGLLTNNLNPDNPTVQIRGLSSLGSESMKPLVILDNFPFEGDLDALNPNDIESISILRDAAAASIWGARAGNGVIVIKSKTARVGQRLSTSVISNMTVSPRPDLFTSNHLPTPEYVEMERMLYEKGYYTARFSMLSSPSIPLVAELMEENRLGYLSDNALEERLDALKREDFRHDMQNYLYRRVANQQYAATMSGSRDRLSFVLSAGFDKNLEHRIGDANQRFNLRSNNTIQFTDKLNMQVGIWMAFQNNTNNSPGGYGDFRGISGYSQLATPSGDALPLDIYYRSLFTDTAGGGQLLDWKYRPLQELALSDKVTRSNDIIINWGMDYSWKYGFTGKIKFQKQFGNGESNHLNHQDSYYTRNLNNRFTQITSGDVENHIPRGAIRESSENTSSSYNIRAQIDFHRSFGRHEVNAIIGSEARDLKNESATSILYGYDKDKLTFTNIDPTTQYASFNNLFGWNYIPFGANLNRYVNRFISLYGNGAYTYSNRYTVTGSVRRDASNLFGVSTNQKWNPLWSVGGLWHLSKEDFFEFSAIKKLSLRATYGYSGNIPLNATALTQINYYGGAWSPVNENFATVFMGPNPSLRWETVRTTNVGLDFEAFSANRLKGNIEYYKKKSTDLFNSTKLDPIVGMSIQPKNSAAIVGSGLDISLSASLIERRFNWSSMLLFSYADFKVTQNLDPPSLDGLVSSGQGIFPVEGYNPYLIASYRWAGLNPENGNPRGYLNDEVSEDYIAMQLNTIEDQILHGPSLPPFFGSWRNTFRWKNWSLLAGLNYKFGHYFRKQALNYGTLFQYGESNGNLEYVNRWRESGDEVHTNVPSIQYPANSRRDNFYRYADINVQKADHIRLNELRLQYQVHATGISLIRSLSCHAFVDNMNVMLWKANTFNVDPENSIGFRRPINFSLGIQLNL